MMDMELLKRTAKLAKLGISGREQELLREWKLLTEYGGSLPPAPEEQAAPAGRSCPLRRDEIQQSLPVEKVLMGAAQIQDDRIAAPRAFD